MGCWLGQRALVGRQAHGALDAAERGGELAGGVGILGGAALILTPKLLAFRIEVAVLTRPHPCSTVFLHHLESATLKRLTVRPHPRDEKTDPMPRVLPPLALTAALTVAFTAALAGLTACGSNVPSGGAASTAPSAASSSVQTAGPEQTTSPGSSAAPQAGTAQVIDLTVTGGQVSGATGRVPVKLGSTVQMQVTADVADEVHVHGYDLMKDTVPGQPVTIEFTANVPGVFEVELEKSKLPLTRLQVQ